MNVMEITNHFLIGSIAYSMKQNPYLAMLKKVKNL